MEESSDAIKLRLESKLPEDATRKQAEPLCLRRLLCPICEVVRSDRSRHCPTCNKCVNRFDHHCPWINNCVGNSNQGLFIFYLLVSILHILAVLAFVSVAIYEAWTDDVTSGEILQDLVTLEHVIGVAVCLGVKALLVLYPLL